MSMNRTGVFVVLQINALLTCSENHPRIKAIEI